MSRGAAVNAQGTIEQRMGRAVTIDPVTGCHLWLRAKNTRGYGVIYFEGKVCLAHRVAFYLANARWPDAGMVTDHICENKGCVNAKHLRELTNSANILRAYRHLDPALESKRAENRIAKAKSRIKQRGGG